MMDADVRYPRARAFDSDYWLCRCEGFLVDSPAGRVGVVEGARFRSRLDRPDLLAVHMLFVAELLEQLRNGVTLSGRKSSALVACTLFRATEARPRTFASLGAHLSELERWSLAQLLRLPAEERRTMAALLRLRRS
jgi:hypothetical protein